MTVQISLKMRNISNLNALNQEIINCILYLKKMKEQIISFFLYKIYQNFIKILYLKGQNLYLRIQLVKIKQNQIQYYLNLKLREVNKVILQQIITGLHLIKITVYPPNIMSILRIQNQILLIKNNNKKIHNNKNLFLYNLHLFLAWFKQMLKKCQIFLILLQQQKMKIVQNYELIYFIMNNFNQYILFQLNYYIVNNQNKYNNKNYNQNLQKKIKISHQKRQKHHLLKMNPKKILILMKNLYLFQILYFSCVSYTSFFYFFSIQNFIQLQVMQKVQEVNQDKVITIISINYILLLPQQHLLQRLLLPQLLYGLQIFWFFVIIIAKDMVIIKDRVITIIMGMVAIIMDKVIIKDMVIIMDKVIIMDMVIIKDKVIIKDMVIMVIINQIKDQEVIIILGKVIMEVNYIIMEVSYIIKEVN